MEKIKNGKCEIKKTLKVRFWFFFFDQKKAEKNAR